MMKTLKISGEKTSELTHPKQQLEIQSLIGPIFIIASKKLIHSITNKRNSRYEMVDSKDSFYPILVKAQEQIQDYLAGKRKKFNLPFAFQGTLFQESIWSEISRIPYGKKISYKELAERIKKPQAARAVGTAVGKNPLCLIIPCHRIIGSNGEIGGFSMGAETKKKLLKLEQTH